jgi:ribosomal protein L12E/L44/L45/RPP1/RPP2
MRSRILVAAEHFTYTLLREQADKLQSLISAAKVPEIEPIWTTLFAKALEGKDVKDLLLNVGSGGGAAPAAGGAAPAAGAADAPAAEEKKEEGELYHIENRNRFLEQRADHYSTHREGGVRRRHGLRSLRLSVSLRFAASQSKYLDDKAGRVFWQAGLRHDMNDDQDDDMWWSGETTPSRMMSRFRSYSLIACGACQAASLFVNECSPPLHFVIYICVVIPVV